MIAPYNRRIQAVSYTHLDVYKRQLYALPRSVSKYNCKEQIEFSSCSWEYGWNVKFKKSGKTLCTIYPRENYFTVLVVVGKKEKDAVKGYLARI